MAARNPGGCVLLAALFAGCESPLIGDWRLTDHPPDGMVHEYQYTLMNDSGVNAEITGTQRFSGGFSVRGDGLSVRLVEGWEIDEVWDHRDPDRANETRHYSVHDIYEGEAEQNKRRAYTLELTLKGYDPLDCCDPPPISLDCELSRDDAGLSCDDPELGLWGFERCDYENGAPSGCDADGDGLWGDRDECPDLAEDHDDNDRDYDDEDGCPGA